MNIEAILSDIMNEAGCCGVEFAEATWGFFQSQHIETRDQLVASTADRDNEGISVRVLHNGAWGFAASPVSDRFNPVNLLQQAISLAKATAVLSHGRKQLSPVTKHLANWKSPVIVDPFSVPLKEKLDLLLSINAEMSQVDRVRETRSHMRFNKFEKHYVNSEGSNIRQSVTRSDVDYTAIAVGNDRFESRDYQGLQRAIGYEGVDGDSMLKEAKRVAEEASDQLTAKPYDKDRADLILLPNHTRLVIHETIGHPTELDRVLGWEADFAGTSFATPEKQGHYKYGSSLFNVTADRTQEHGLATCLFDDEGVPTESWPLISNGLLMDYSTTRDTAPLIGAVQSHGCAYADNWSSFPILRMPNVCIDPGKDDNLTLKTLIENTEDGILVDGMAAFSIDHQRLNFQFSGDYCRRITNGQLAEPLWNVVYNGRNPDFWNSMDAICGRDDWVPHGIYGCAKGQPVQTTALTHGSSPLRLRNIEIVRSK